MLNGLTVSFIDAMNEKLVPPLTTLELFKAVKGMVDGNTLGHDDIPIDFFKE